MKILIADDKESTRFMLKKYLNDWGDMPVEAVDGESAWEILNNDDPPRIAILDWMMPGMNGIEICNKLTERKNAPFVYSILLTTREDKEDLVYALDNGAYNFQTKPISQAELKSHISVGKRLVRNDDQLKEYTMRIENLAVTDSLTGVSNRRHFMEKGNNAVDMAKRYGRDLSVLLMDLDRFKETNDTWGHAAGDKTLTAFADLCKASLRKVDILGRIGGEEFAIVLPETDTQSAFQVAERIRKRVENLQVMVKHNAIRFTVSIGVSLYIAGDDTVDTLLERADEALYRAKRQGRNRTLITD